MQSSAVMLMNDLISGHAVCDFRDTVYGKCSLLNVSVGCDGDFASCVGEYIDGSGDLVGVYIQFECRSVREALAVMYRFARMEKPDVGLGDIVRQFSYETTVHDYSVMTLYDGYRWPDYSEIA